MRQQVAHLLVRSRATAREAGGLSASDGKEKRRDEESSILTHVFGRQSPNESDAKQVDESKGLVKRRKQ